MPRASSLTYSYGKVGLHKPYSTYQASPPSAVGSSSYASTSSTSLSKPTSSTHSRKRDTATRASAEHEKRLKRYRHQPTSAIKERAERVSEQRFFCVDRSKTSATSEQFSVLGSTGNVYTVTIQQIPECSCPDGLRGNHCKHIIFVFLRVLGVSRYSNLWYQAALLQSELKQIFSEARPSPQAIVDQRVSTAYRVATGQELAPAGGSSSLELVQKRLPGEEDACPICYENFEPGSEEGLVFCLSAGGCGNGLHRECFDNWRRAATGKVTCVMCRQPWQQPMSKDTGSKGGASFSEGYLNLSHLTGQSRQRDTSSYYQGPRRRGQGGSPDWMYNNPNWGDYIG
ncbi:hypothetical protein OIO90_003741 [Microbotryomycetes sp. JL221]|nr:hypothetical protein OIO90_003741 [Microbotryomycetes sp. JL221]